MTAYYNEIDPYAAQWLRNLIAAGHLPAGDVDERSIEDVTPRELAGYTQCHFFAGLGGWPHALRLAGWPDNRPVWTGSCPCQPFSAAGKGAGLADERHLWPSWQYLIAQCRPSILFGEQVASKAAESWIDLVHADLEGMGYAFGCIAFPAAGVGAPHIRDRTYWVGDADSARWEGYAGIHRSQEGAGPRHVESERHGATRRLADANGDGRITRSAAAPSARYGRTAWPTGGDDRPHTANPANGGWGAADWLRCTDGRWRPVEPGTFPLADGISARVGRLRAYGNAIVPQAASAFVSAWLEVRQGVK